MQPIHQPGVTVTDIQLRDYQADVIVRIRAEMAAGSKATLLTLPTGGGKTFIFCYVVARAVAAGNRVIVLVHRQELLAQTSASLTALGVRHGCIAAGYGWTPNDRVQVASVQTLVKRLDLLASCQWWPTVIVVDEAHHATAGTWAQILEHFGGRLRHTLGVTATPCRMDGRGLGDVFDAMVMGPQIGELIDAGHLCQPITYVPPGQIDMDGVPMSGSDFQRGATADRAMRPTITGAVVAHYSRIVQGAPAIAFCVSVAHAEHVAEEFRVSGYQAASLDGKTDPLTRRRMIEDLGRGKLQVLTSCDIISEGTDIPIVTAGIMIRPTHSLGLHLQQGGRCLRPHPDKRFAFLIDHAGNVGRHGLLEAPRQWSLAGRLKSSRGPRDPDDVPPPLTCRHCFGQNPHPYKPVCQWCRQPIGAEKDRMEQLLQDAADLVEVNAAAARARMDAEAEKKRKRWEDLREQDACKDAASLRDLGRRRGMKHPETWAMHIMTARARKKGVDAASE